MGVLIPDFNFEYYRLYLALHNLKFLDQSNLEG